MLMQIDTRLLEQFSPILVVIILLCMVISVMRFLLSKNTMGAVASIGICGLLLWAVSNPNSLMSTISNIVAFMNSIFKA